MEIILIILTSTILSACFLYVYKLGYDKGTKQVKDGVELNKINSRILKEYANFVSYVGDERGE